MANPQRGCDTLGDYSHPSGRKRSSFWTAIAHTQNPPVSGGVAINEKVEGRDVRLSQGLFGWFLLAQPAFRFISLV